jgi:hypothetical protein
MNKKWLVITALAMGLPSAIFGTAFILYLLHKEGIISQLWAFIILLAVVANIFYLMLYYAFNKKNKF